MHCIKWSITYSIENCILKISNSPTYGKNSFSNCNRGKCLMFTSKFVDASMNAPKRSPRHLVVGSRDCAHVNI